MTRLLSFSGACYYFALCSILCITKVESKGILNSIWNSISSKFSYSDENANECSHVTNVTHFSCNKDGQPVSECVPNEWVCDGKVDCSTEKDEKFCFNDVCPFRCVPIDMEDEFCVPRDWVCNKVVDCVNGLDEKNCSYTDDVPNWCQQCEHSCSLLSQGCTCKPGYKLRSDNVSCALANPCLAASTPCSHECTNDDASSFTCSCPPGYRLASDRRTCKVKGPNPTLFYTANGRLYNMNLRTLKLDSEFSIPEVNDPRFAFEATGEYHFAGKKAFSVITSSGYYRYYNSTGRSNRDSIIRSNPDLTIKSSLLFKNMGTITSTVLDLKTQVRLFASSGKIYVTKVEPYHFDIASDFGIVPVGVLDFTHIVHNRRIDSVAVDSEAGLLFFSVSSQAVIYRSHLDGNNVSKFALSTDFNFNYIPRSLTIDLNSDYLFIVTLGGSVIALNRRTGATEIIISSDVARVAEIALFEGSLYWFDLYTQCISRSFVRRPALVFMLQKKILCTNDSTTRFSIAHPITRLLPSHLKNQTSKTRRRELLHAFPHCMSALPEYCSGRFPQLSNASDFNMSTCVFAPSVYRDTFFRFSFWRPHHLINAVTLHTQTKGVSGSDFLILLSSQNTPPTSCGVFRGTSTEKNITVQCDLPVYAQSLIIYWRSPIGLCEVQVYATSLRHGNIQDPCSKLKCAGVCLPSNSSYARCVCPLGYQRSGDGRSCLVEPRAPFVLLESAVSSYEGFPSPGLHFDRFRTDYRTLPFLKASTTQSFNPKPLGHRLHCAVDSVSVPISPGMFIRQCADCYFDSADHVCRYIFTNSTGVYMQKPLDALGKGEFVLLTQFSGIKKYKGSFVSVDSVSGLLYTAESSSNSILITNLVTNQTYQLLHAFRDKKDLGFDVSGLEIGEIVAAQGLGIFYFTMKTPSPLNNKPGSRCLIVKCYNAGSHSSRLSCPVSEIILMPSCFLVYSLSIDYKDNRLFWIFKMRHDKFPYNRPLLMAVDLNKRSDSAHAKPYVVHRFYPGLLFFQISQRGHRVFYSYRFSGISHGIIRGNYFIPSKSNDVLPSRSSPSFSTYSILPFDSPTIRKEFSIQTCKNVSLLGCSHFCVTNVSLGRHRIKATCGCPKGFILKSDNRTCERLRCDGLSLHCDKGHTMECLPFSRFCDGYIDCNGGSDESPERCSTCPYGARSQFYCRNLTKSLDFHNRGHYDFTRAILNLFMLPVHKSKLVSARCLPNEVRCDGYRECASPDDEKNCDYCQPRRDLYHCSKSRLCLSKDKSIFCNGISECPLGEDEEDCPSCKDDEFKCASGRTVCIKRHWVCDGDADCADGSDERDCAGSDLPHTCAPNEFSCDGGICLSSTLKCNLEQDCADNTDEMNCLKTTTLTPLSCDSATQLKLRCTQKCVIALSGPECSCEDGYRLHPSDLRRRICTDIDECDSAAPRKCSQGCSNTDGGFNCSCTHSGYVLHSDGQKCILDRSVTIPVLYVMDQHEIRSFAVDDDLQSIKIFLQKGASVPKSRTKRLTKSTRRIDPFAMTYYFNPELPNCGNDHRKLELFWFRKHERAVMRTQPIADHKITVYKNISRWYGEIGGVAVDYLSGNLYMTHPSRGMIMACEIRNSSKCATVMVDVFNPPISIAVYPEKGMMFWTTRRSSGFSHLMQASMDGGSFRELHGAIVRDAADLAIDIPSERLFWTDAKYKRIGVYSLRRDITDFIPLEGTDYRPVSLSILEDSIYIIDDHKRVAFTDSWGRDRVWRLMTHVSDPRAMLVWTHPVLQPEKHEYGLCNQRSKLCPANSLCLLSNRAQRYHCLCANDDCAVHEPQPVMGDYSTPSPAGPVLFVLALILIILLIVVIVFVFRRYVQRDHVASPDSSTSLWSQLSKGISTVGVSLKVASGLDTRQRVPEDSPNESFENPTFNGKCLSPSKCAQPSVAYEVKSDSVSISGSSPTKVTELESQSSSPITSIDVSFQSATIHDIDVPCAILEASTEEVEAVDNPFASSHTDKEILVTKDNDPQV